MKRLSITMICAAGLTLMTACGNKNAKNVADGEDKVSTESAEFTGEKYSKDAAIYFFDKNYGIDFKELEPDFKYDESGQYTFKGDASEVAARFKDPEGNYTVEQIEGWVRKLYAATAKGSEGGKNVYGFLLSGKNTLEEAKEEKSIDEVLKGGYTEIFGIKAFTGSYSWAILKDGKFQDVSVSIMQNKEATKDSQDLSAYAGRGYAIEIQKGLQKNLDDTMKDAEEAFDKIENDPELKKQVQDAINSEMKKVLPK